MSVIYSLNCRCRSGEAGWWVKATHNLTEADIVWAETAAERRIRADRKADVLSTRAAARAQVGVCAILGWEAVPEGWVIRSTLGMPTLTVNGPRPGVRYILATVAMREGVVTLHGWCAAEELSGLATPVTRLHRFPLEGEPPMGRGYIPNRHVPVG